MKSLLVACALGAVMFTPAYAKSFAIPEKNPVATVVLPDDWEADEIDTGVEVTSKDGTVYLAFETVKASKAEAALKEGVDYVTGKGVKIDGNSIKQEELTLNGMKGVSVSFTGKDDDGDAEVSLLLLVPTSDRLVMLTYWGSPDGAKANGEALTNIAKSIKPVN